MKIKAGYLVMLMVLFMAVVFLDENSTPVPMKILFGNPYHFGLSFIVVVSMLVGATLTMLVVYLRGRKKDS